MLYGTKSFVFAFPVHLESVFICSLNTTRIFISMRKTARCMSIATEIKLTARFLGKSVNLRYFLQNFTDSGDIIGKNLNSVEKEKINSMLKTALTKGLNAKIRNE